MASYAERDAARCLERVSERRRFETCRPAKPFRQGLVFELIHGSRGQVIPQPVFQRLRITPVDPDPAAGIVVPPFELLAVEMRDIHVVVRLQIEFSQPACKARRLTGRECPTYSGGGHFLSSPFHGDRHTARRQAVPNISQRNLGGKGLLWRDVQRNVLRDAANRHRSGPLHHVLRMILDLQAECLALGVDVRRGNRRPAGIPCGNGPFHDAPRRLHLQVQRLQPATRSGLKLQKNGPLAGLVRHEYRLIVVASNRCLPQLLLGIMDFVDGRVLCGEFRFTSGHEASCSSHGRRFSQRDLEVMRFALWRIDQNTTAVHRTLLRVLHWLAIQGHAQHGSFHG